MQVRVFFRLLGSWEVEGFAWKGEVKKYTNVVFKVSSTSHPGGNQVDGLPPASSSTGHSSGLFWKNF